MAIQLYAHLYVRVKGYFKAGRTDNGMLSAADMATDRDVSRQTIHEILRKRHSITPEMALRLSRFFGNAQEFWLNAQHARDPWNSEQPIKAELDRIQPLHAA
jgi:addiction module HigA family antidote